MRRVFIDLAQAFDFFSPLGEHTRGINYISFLLISTRLAQCLLDSSPLPFIIFLLLQCLSLVHRFPSVPQGSLFSPSYFSSLFLKVKVLTFFSSSHFLLSFLSLISLVQSKQERNDRRERGIESYFSSFAPLPLVFLPLHFFFSTLILS